MKLNFKEQGRGEPLVMLHGLFGSLDNWLGVAPRLAHQDHLYLVDLRNHGHSPHSGDMDYPLMAADVAEFFHDHKLSRANVLGHSLGGKVAMEFALAHPGLVAKLIVVDMAPRLYPPDHLPFLKAMLALDLKQFKNRTGVEKALEPEIPDLTLRRFLLKNLKPTASSHAAPKPGEDETSHFEWRIPLPAFLANYPNLCQPLATGRSFPHPTLFLRGGQSPYVSDADVPLIRQLFPQSKIETIANARHWVHADAPDDFVRHVMDFLKE